MKGNLVIGQSGGPTAVINASVAGIVSGAVKQGFDGEILGMVNGIEGLLNENFLDLKRFSDKDEKEALIDTPSAYLGSCRFKMPKPEKDPGIYEKIFNIIKKRNIRYFLYIGGNDSMDTVYRLSEYARGRDWEMSIVGVPKSIDNDLAGTDHCPGYGSAAKFIASSIREMAIDTGVYNLKSVLIVEIMGRNAGWLTASAALARNEDLPAPDLIYLPEADFAPDKVFVGRGGQAKGEKHRHRRGVGGHQVVGREIYLRLGCFRRGRQFRPQIFIRRGQGLGEYGKRTPRRQGARGGA